MQRAQVRFLVREPDPTCCVVRQGVGNKPTRQTKSLVKPAVLPACPCSGPAPAMAPLSSGGPIHQWTVLLFASVFCPSGLPTPASHFSDSFCSKLLVFQNTVPSSSTPLSGTLSNLTPRPPPPITPRVLVTVTAESGGQSSWHLTCRQHLTGYLIPSSSKHFPHLASEAPTLSLSSARDGFSSVSLLLAGLSSPLPPFMPLPPDDSQICISSP